MDRHLTTVLLLVLLLAVGVMPGTVTTSSAQMEDDDSMGHSVSSFMQVSAVEADSTVEREMWQESFENADNESERTELIEQRSEQLSRDLSTVRDQRQQLENGDASPVYTSALDAHVTELRQSVQNANQTANESNVSSNTLSELRDEACNVSVSNDSETVIVSNGTELRCPPQSPGNNTANNSTDTPQDPGDDPDNNSTDTPQDPGDDPANNSTDTPQDPANNSTDTPQDPGDDPDNDTPQDPANNSTDTPQDPANNSTDTPQETPSTTETETEDSGPIFGDLPLMSNRSSVAGTVDAGSDRPA